MSEKSSASDSKDDQMYKEYISGGRLSLHPDMAMNDKDIVRESKRIQHDLDEKTAYDVFGDHDVIQQSALFDDVEDVSTVDAAAKPELVGNGRRIETWEHHDNVKTDFPSIEILKTHHYLILYEAESGEDDVYIFKNLNYSVPTIFGANTTYMDAHIDFYDGISVEKIVPETPKNINSGSSTTLELSLGPITVGSRISGGGQLQPDGSRTRYEDGGEAATKLTTDTGITPVGHGIGSTAACTMIVGVRSDQTPYSWRSPDWNFEVYGHLGDRVNF